MAGQPLEVEVKFLVEDLEALHRRLLAAGAVLHKPRTHEYNLRYDTPTGDLAQGNRLLRLRRDTGTRLTYKGPPQDDPAAEALVRPELETALADFEAMDAILRRLGFGRVQVYEKYRQTYALGEIEVMLDELPYGDFVELEGPEPALRRAAAQLGLDWQRRILDNYLQMLALLKARHDLPFDDLTFENFAAVSARAADLFP